MYGFEGLFPALLILLLLYGIAAIVLIAAAIAAMIGVSFWRKGKQTTAFFLNIPAFVCLIALLGFFAPGILSHRYVTIDLTRPFDLSGIPKDVYWFPQGVPGAPETHPGWFCCVERGNIFAHVKLLNGQIIEDSSLRAFIYVDEHGIYKVDLFSTDVSASTALRRAKPILAALLSQSTDKRSKEFKDRVEFELETYEYVPSSSYARFTPPNMEVVYGFGAARTLLPFRHVYYYYNIDVVYPKPKPKPIPKPEYEKFEARGIKYKVPFADNGQKIGNEGEFSFENDFVALREIRGHLNVNGEEADLVKVGDSVVVDNTGVVLVNGILRTTVVLYHPVEK